MNKYTKKQNQQGDYMLLINDVQSICPFVPAIPMAGQYGGLNVMRMPCSSSCPLCVASDTEWAIHCGNKTITYPLELEDKKIVPLSSL